MRVYFLIPASLALIWFIVSMAAITEFNRTRGIKINWILIRLKIFQYVNNYREITLKENGKPGFWYYSFLASFTIFLILAVAAIVISKSLE